MDRSIRRESIPRPARTRGVPGVSASTARRRARAPGLQARRREIPARAERGAASAGSPRPKHEAITLFVNGEPESAKPILRDLVNATVGLETLAEEIHKPAESLHRMLSKSGNPTMSNISAVFAAIKRALKVEVHTCAVMT